MRYSFVLVAALLLAGCAPTKPDHIARQADSGYLFADLPSWKAPKRITVKSLATAKEYSLGTNVGAAGGTLGSWLPAGDYALEKWDRYVFKGYPPIHIEAGRATTLGSLVSIQAGGYKFFVVPEHTAEAQAALDGVKRQLGPEVAAQPPLEWHPVKPPEPFETDKAVGTVGLAAYLISAYEASRNEPALRQQMLTATSIDTILELARVASVPVMDFPYADGSGSLYYGAELGQIRVRQASGDWSAWDTGTLRSVTALTRRDGIWFAGYEDGAIRSSSDGKTWQLIARLPNGEAVQDLVWAGSRWLVLSMRRAPLFLLQGVAHASMLSTDGDSFVTFHTLREKDFDPRMNVGVAGPRGQRAGDHYYLSFPPELARLDMRTMTWTKLEVPTEISGFAVNKDASVVTAYLSKGIFSKLYVSSDRGGHWSLYDMPPIATLRIAFTDESNGEALRNDAHAFTSDLQKFRYRKASNDWVLAEQYPEGCRRVINDEEGKPKFCLTGAGSIIGRNGKDWRIEFAAD